MPAVSVTSPEPCAAARAGSEGSSRTVKPQARSSWAAQTGSAARGDAPGDGGEHGGVRSAGRAWAAGGGAAAMLCRGPLPPRRR